MRKLLHSMLFNSLSLKNYNLSLYDEQGEFLASKASTANHDASSYVFLSNFDELDWLQIERHVNHASELAM
jgi:hypothetical protein